MLEFICRRYDHLIDNKVGSDWGGYFATKRAQYNWLSIRFGEGNFFDVAQIVLVAHQADADEDKKIKAITAKVIESREGKVKLSF